MRKFSSIALMAGLLAPAPVASARADPPPQTKSVAADPNERVCEDVIVTGSRLAKKRFCGTRAEWKEKQKQDRDVIEDVQRHAADPCHAILTHTGAPTC
jgi:hypothetical protein